MFYKMAPSFISDYIPQRNIIDPSPGNRDIIPPFPRTEWYDNSFLPFCIYNGNSLNDKIKTQFKKDISSFVRPKGTHFYGIRENFGIKLLTKIRVDFSDLRDHRYNHNFNCVNPICSCGLDDETPIHYFLCCPRYNSLRLISYLMKQQLKLYYSF